MGNNRKSAALITLTKKLHREPMQFHEVPISQEIHAKSLILHAQSRSWVWVRAGGPQGF